MRREKLRAGCLAGIFILGAWAWAGTGEFQGRRSRRSRPEVQGKERRFGRNWVIFAEEGIPWKVYVEDVASPLPKGVAGEALPP